MRFRIKKILKSLSYDLIFDVAIKRINQTAHRANVIVRKFIALAVLDFNCVTKK